MPALLVIGFMLSGASMILSNLLLYWQLRKQDPLLSPVLGTSRPFFAILYFGNLHRYGSKRRTTTAPPRRAGSSPPVGDSLH